MKTVLFSCLVLSRSEAADAPVVTTSEHHFYIEEYQVVGNRHLLSQSEFEDAVYPYIGPYRTTEDVEQARARWKKPTTTRATRPCPSSIPPQRRRGVVTLQVVRNRSGRLRVHGSRYFSIDGDQAARPRRLRRASRPTSPRSRTIWSRSTSSPDRRVTPIPCKPGVMPGTVDVDLDVKDTFPLHGSLELNNRYSADTTPLRLNGSVSYDNLWQLGHRSASAFSSRRRTPTRCRSSPATTSRASPMSTGSRFMLQGTDQDSNVNTLGGIGVAGNGEVDRRPRPSFTLPQLESSTTRSASASTTSTSTRTL